MKDYVFRATALQGKARAFGAYTRHLVEELRERHQMSPTATAALGRTATAGLMMGIMLKGEEKLTIQIKGGGPIGQVVVDANAHAQVRGYVDHPDVDLPLNAQGKLDVAGAVGTDGFLHIVKDLGLKEPYRGSIPIVSGEIAEDFTYYFAKSEQTPSVVALGVLVDRDRTVKTAGGIIIQLMPEATDEDIARLESRLGELASITTRLNQGDTIESILLSVLPDMSILERNDQVSFRCQCSRERVERTLISLGRKELSQLAEDDGQANLVCHFCNETYYFDKKSLEAIIQSL